MGKRPLPPKRKEHQRAPGYVFFPTKPFHAAMQLEQRVFLQQSFFKELHRTEGGIRQPPMQVPGESGMFTPASQAGHRVMGRFEFGEGSLNMPSLAREWGGWRRNWGDSPRFETAASCSFHRFGIPVAPCTACASDRRGQREKNRTGHVVCWTSCLLAENQGAQTGSSRIHPEHMG